LRVRPSSVGRRHSNHASGDVLGHETVSEVVEVGKDNKKLKVGDRVVVPFTIACGECFFCTRLLFRLRAVNS